MRIFKACIFIAAAIVISALSLPNLFPSTTASLVDKLSMHVGSTTAITQSAADAKSLKPADKVTPTLTEIAVSRPVDQSQTENGESQSDILFRQFQSWAAAQANNVAPVRAVQDVPAKIVQDAPKRIAENTRKPLPLVQKRRDARSPHSEASTQIPRKPLQPVQSARAQVQPVQSVRAQEQAAANPSLNATEAQWATQRSQ